MIALGRIVLPGLLSLLAVALQAQPVENSGAAPAAVSDDDAHCGCGEGKMARVAAQTQVFADQVDALGRDMVSGDGDTHTRLLAYEQACRQRQPVADAPMSKEMRQWVAACSRVSELAARYAR